MLFLLCLQLFVRKLLLIIWKPASLAKQTKVSRGNKKEKMIDLSSKPTKMKKLQ